jgi:SAM-dependent methyltransferase
MISQNKVENYGWRDSEKVCSHSYLAPAVIDVCQKLGARRILDLGCGNGALSRTLSDAGFEVTGCDSDNIGIELAQRANPGLTFKTVGVYDDPALLGGSFDAVVSAEVVEHLFLPRYLPKFARTVLKSGGYLIVTTPYHGYVKNLIVSLLDKWDHHHNPLWDGGHIKFWSRPMLTRLLEEEGFVVKSFMGVGRFPYVWKSMILVAQKA